MEGGNKSRKGTDNKESIEDVSKVDANTSARGTNTSPESTLNKFDQASKGPDGFASTINLRSASSSASASAFSDSSSNTARAFNKDSQSNKNPDKNAIKGKSNPSSASYQHTFNDVKPNENSDLLNNKKYEDYSAKWTFTNSASTNYDSFRFSANEKKSTFANESNSGFTAKDLDSFVWMDLNKRLNELSKDLDANKKNLVGNKRSIANVISKVASQTAKLENFDTTLKQAEEKLEGKVVDFEKEIVIARNSLLAVIALFASFFTFISISVNIFSRDMSLSTSISVLLIIWCCLISFIFVFMAGINKGITFFTSCTFIKHAIFMVLLFICAFTLPRAIFYILPVQWFP